MRLGEVLLDGLCLIGLGLPALTVYRRWPDFIYAYCGAAVLALLLIGWLLPQRPKHDS